MLPVLVQTGLNGKLGSPKDYTAAALWIAKQAGQNVDVTIPDAKDVQQATQICGAKLMALKDLKIDQTNWKIKVRVTKKQSPKSCKSGTGKMQKIDLIDADATEMSMLLFDDAIVAIGESIIENEVYNIINGRVQKADVQWRKHKEVMIFADKKTKVQHAVDDNTIPEGAFSFVSFEDVKDYKGRNIDIIGRALLLPNYSHGKNSNTEILLKNYDGAEIAAVF